MARSRFKLLAIIAVLIVTVSTIVFAQPEAVLNAGETSDRTSFYAGDNVQIDGNVNGNVFAAGNTVVVNGKIDGNLFAAGNVVNAGGEVTGSVFAAGNNVTILGKSRDASVAASSLTITDDAEVERDFTYAGAGANLGGKIGRDFMGFFDTVSVTDSFTVGRDMEYSASEEIPGIDSKVGGTVKFEDAAQVQQEAESKTAAAKFGLGVLSFIKSVIGLLIVWALGKVIKKNMWIESAVELKKKPLVTFGIGVASIIVGIVLLFLLLLTGVGAAASLIGMAFYGIFMYTSQIVSAVAIGDAIFKGKEIHYGVWGALIGIVIIKVLGLIPFVGFIIKFMVASFGFGAIMINLYRKRGYGPKVPADTSLN